MKNLSIALMLLLAACSGSETGAVADEFESGYAGCEAGATQCLNGTTIQHCVDAGGGATDWVNSPCSGVCVESSLDGPAQCAAECENFKCYGKSSQYACPKTEIELWSTGKYCRRTSDTNAYDHRGTCYREVVQPGQRGGQQCCYGPNSEGVMVDNCTGSYDKVAPYVMGPTFNPNNECTTSMADTAKVCDHCEEDVLPFCDAHCSNFVDFTWGWNPFGNLDYYTNCWGFIDEAYPDCSEGQCAFDTASNIQTWTKPACGCTNTAFTNFALDFICHPDPQGQDVLSFPSLPNVPESNWWTPDSDKQLYCEGT